MKFSKYIIKAVTIVMALFQKQHRLFFKQSYDTLRLSRCESAASAGTAQSERCLHRNQRAVSTSHNVPSDTMFEAMLQGEMDSHLGYGPNVHGPKTQKTAGMATATRR